MILMKPLHWRSKKKSSARTSELSLSSVHLSRVGGSTSYRLNLSTLKLSWSIQTKMTHRSSYSIQMEEGLSA
ncbi:hypothetical protein KRP22_001612 [Phytophthora ramorum]|nr:hypothetical protein KRP22_893 [Phytophthora ramorum]